MCSVYSDIPGSVIPGRHYQSHFTDDVEARKTRTRAGEVAQWLRAAAALAEDPGVSEITWWLLASSNSSSGGPDALFWSLWALQSLHLTFTQANSDL